MFKLVSVLDNSVGQKVVAGLTGIALVGFLVVHMAGNLQIFAGAEALNKYAALLKSSAFVLWSARLSLAALVTLHVAMTIRQAVRNRDQRRRAYGRQHFQRTTRASRSMMLTGSLILGFLIFHLLHFTVGLILPKAHDQVDSGGRHDVYRMVVAGFRNPWIVSIYVMGMLALATHLKHAISSALQTLGLARNGDQSAVRKASPFLAAVIIIGFISVPLSVATGLIPENDDQEGASTPTEIDKSDAVIALDFEESITRSE